MTEIIKMGIAGCGNVARKIHYPQRKLRAHQFQVVACCDISRARAEEVARLYDAAPYDNLPAFLRDIRVFETCLAGAHRQDKEGRQ